MFPIIYKTFRITRLLLSLLLLLAACDVEAGTLSIIGQQRWVHIVGVHDGDSLRTAQGERIRLLGINAPEVANQGKPGQIMGDEARLYLTKLVLGKLVQLRTDKEKVDIYGRTLAQVYLRNGTWINARMLRQGFAYVYTFAPNFRWTNALQKAEAEARNNKRGIWKSERFRILKSKSVSKQHVGQFRVVAGTVSAVRKWRFRLGKLQVSIPRKYRQWFKNKRLAEQGKKITVRGTIRLSGNGKLYIALHSPADLES